MRLDSFKDFGAILIIYLLTYLLNVRGLLSAAIFRKQTVLEMSIISEIQRRDSHI